MTDSPSAEMTEAMTATGETGMTIVTGGTDMILATGKLSMPPGSNHADRTANLAGSKKTLTVVEADAMMTAADPQGEHHDHTRADARLQSPPLSLLGLARPPCSSSRL